MTNGEKIKQIFPGLQIDEGELEVYMWTTIHDAIDIPLEWWNAEYKEPNYLEIPIGSMDYISKQEVVGLMMHIWGENFSGDDAMQECIDAIRVMPSVTPQEPRWISVSERLPEKAFGCLVTVEEDDIYGELHRVIYPDFVGYDGETWNDADGNVIPFDVIAWMPLPAPFEPQGHMSYIEKEKLIKADIASIENRVRHAFNQGYDLGYKEGKEKAKALEQEPIDYRTQYENYLKKSEVVISQLRADRDRLQDAFDKLRAEIEQAAFKNVSGSKFIFVNRVNQIIDKYKAETET